MSKKTASSEANITIAKFIFSEKQSNIYMDDELYMTMTYRIVLSTFWQLKYNMIAAWMTIF